MLNAVDATSSHAQLPEIGFPVDAVDTPALLVDLDVLERNLEVMHDFFRNRPVKVRSVTKGHKCPAIAARQMRYETAVPFGLACTKAAEVEAMLEAGARDVRMIEQVVGAAKIDRLVALAERVRVIAVVDDVGQVRGLEAAAAARGLRLDVTLEVEIGLGRCGVQPGEAAVALARDIARSPHLRFAGLHAHEGAIMDADPEVRAAKANERFRRLTDCREDVEGDGLEVEICGAGATTTWNIAGVHDGITEIDPGSYALMDHRLVSELPDLGFDCALSLVATVISRPMSARAVIDAGHKALGMATDGGLPGVATPGLRVNRVNSEHGILDVEESARGPAVGETVRLIPRYHGSAVLAHDHLVAIRDERVEAIWPIAARGAHF